MPEVLKIVLGAFAMFLIYPSSRLFWPIHTDFRLAYELCLPHSWDVSLDQRR